MSESQSRYSIVERLTQMKLNIITDKLELDEDLKIKQQHAEQLKKDVVDWEKDIQKDIERTKRLKQREIEKAEISSENAKQIKAAKENSLNEKIKAIDKALERIEEISKTSPTQQSWAQTNKKGHVPELPNGKKYAKPCCCIPAGEILPAYAERG